jgi:hypothetical protein
MGQARFTSELVSPCGMNCGICRAYLARKYEISRQRGRVSWCEGCLPRGKNCYIKRGCKRLSKHEVQSCSECKTMPCDKLAHLDKRYRERYGMSMIENLKIIKEKGVDEFLSDQAEKYFCPNCSTGVLCVHDNKCFNCGYKGKTRR